MMGGAFKIDVSQNNKSADKAGFLRPSHIWLSKTIGNKSLHRLNTATYMPLI